MAKGMKLAAAASSGLLLLFSILYAYLPKDWIQSAAITFGTIAYHFCMRLGVGAAVNCRMKNRADVTNPWYQTREWEKRMYDRIGVKHWKHHLPTYDADAFSPKRHTWEEIAEAMCQAEIVHEIIVPLSFLPLAAVPRYGALPVFLITSILSALYDLQFVVLQRYNRPRILRMVEKQKK